MHHVPDEAMPELFDVRNCHRLKHMNTANTIVLGHPFFLLGSRKTLMRSIGFHTRLYFPTLETSTVHRTEHFPMGDENCYITFHTHEFLFLFPVGVSTIVP